MGTGRNAAWRQLCLHRSPGRPGSPAGTVSALGCRRLGQATTKPKGQRWEGVPETQTREPPNLLHQCAQGAKDERLHG